jgi:DNA polymerase-1
MKTSENFRRTMVNEITLDIETNGLNPTKIWCVSVRDSRGHVGHYTSSADFHAYLDYLHAGDTIFAHNGITFDFPILKRLWGTDLTRFKLRDTLVMSRLAKPDREGGHSVEEWGKRLGLHKPSHEDWSRYSKEMQVRCDEDVRIQQRILEELKGELSGYSEESLELEHETARIIYEQECNGWLLDERKCYETLAILKEAIMEAEETVRATFRPIATFEGEVTPKVKKNKELSVVGLKFLGDQWTTVGGPFSKISWPEFNLGSRPQIARYLIRAGWKPKMFTEKGAPMCNEKILSRIEGIKEADVINRYLMLTKRRAMIESWLDAQEPSGRVHGTVNPCGAVTRRMTHKEPNVAQVTASGKEFGKECRECWTVPQGYSLVGVDASGLELRMLAHYMADPEYIKEVESGDVHTANMKAAGLTSRDQAKTFIYAFLYGAGDAKIGSIVGKGAKEGGRLKAKFLQGLPALKKFKGTVDNASKRGYVTSLDGGRIWIRSPHSALNTVLQGAGAVVMKKALTLLDHHVKLRGMDVRFVGNIHDEIQAEVREDQAEAYGRLAVSCIQAAGIELNMRCPLDGEFKIGTRWSETH